MKYQQKPAGVSLFLRCGSSVASLRGHRHHFQGEADWPVSLLGDEMTTRGNIKRVLFAGVATAAVALGAQTARAGGIGIHAQSAVGQGMSFAGEGTPGMGLSAMFWNPAAVTQVTGFQNEIHGTLYFPHSTMTADPSSTLVGTFGLGSSSGNIGQFAYIPASFYAYQVNPNWYLGLSIGSPYGSSTHEGQHWAGSVYTNVARIKTIDFNPIVGYKINDQLSVAAGPRLLWAFNGRFSNNPALALGLGSSAAVERLGDTAFGYSLGLTYTPTPWTEIAVGYKSRINLNLNGDLVIQAPLPGAGRQDVNGAVTTPDQINLGVRQRIDERWTALGTVEWTNWSLVQNVPFILKNGGGTATTLTFNYRDGWLFSGGLEYQWSPQTTLRGGIAYEISPVRGDQTRDISLPDGNRWWFSAGFTHVIDAHWTVDLGYSFVYVGKTNFNYVPGHPDFTTPFTLIGEADSSNHIVALALRHKW